MADALLATLPAAVRAGGLLVRRYVGLAMLERAPERIERFALLCTAPGPTATPRASTAPRTNRGDRQGRLREGARAPGGRCWCTLAGRRRGAAGRAARGCPRQRPAAAGAHLRACMARPDRTELLAAYRGPSMMLATADDQVVPADGMRECRRARGRGAVRRDPALRPTIAAGESPARWRRGWCAGWSRLRAASPIGWAAPAARRAPASARRCGRCPASGRRMPDLSPGRSPATAACRPGPPAVRSRAITQPRRGCVAASWSSRSAARATAHRAHRRASRAVPGPRRGERRDPSRACGANRRQHVQRLGALLGEREGLDQFDGQPRVPGRQALSLRGEPGVAVTGSPSRARGSAWNTVPAWRSSRPRSGARWPDISASSVVLAAGSRRRGPASDRAGP